MALSTPILILAFNRVEEFTRTIEQLKRFQPQKLYVNFDAPRQGNKADREASLVMQKILRKLVDWPCELDIRTPKTNLGLKMGVINGISWFFESEESGVILEDDILTDESFYWFAQELLEHYWQDPEIMGISGDNCNGLAVTRGSTYGFSTFPIVWGWAGWAWKWRSLELDAKTIQLDEVAPKLSTEVERRIWGSIFQRMASTGKPDSWAYLVTHEMLLHNMKWAFPKWNLVSNIGFTSDSTHTANLRDARANHPTKKITKLRHPSNKNVDRKARVEQLQRITDSTSTPLRRRLWRIFHQLTT